MIKHKYKAKAVKVNDIHFSSTAEAKRYKELEALKNNGEVLFFLRQTPFHLPAKVKYVCDFTVFWKDGNVTFEDVKGFKTDLYKVKKKMVEELYAPLEIKEI
jgi:hypothetical protein